MDLVPGCSAELTCTVTAADTAEALGSGNLPVLATPRLLAWAEAACVRALAGRLGDGDTSVGTRVVLDHVAPSALGHRVAVRAEVTEVDGRRVLLAVTATGADGERLAQGTAERVVVDPSRFMARLGDAVEDCSEGVSPA